MPLLLEERIRFETSGTILVPHNYCVFVLMGQAEQAAEIDNILRSFFKKA